jgi:uncharacterized protein involved in exopolysaccharide biosynthesis
LNLDFDTVVTQVRRQFKLFAALVAAAVVISVIVALLSRPVYRSEAVVAPVSDDALSNLGGLSGQLGGLASLAGGLLGGSKNWNKALAVLRSRHLIEELVTRENLLPVLFPKKRSWLPWAAAPGAAGRGPTMGDAVYLFRNTILQIREDTKAGTATVRVEWFDPKLAADWANELVELADTEERNHAVVDAQSSLTALRQELERTDAVDLRGAIAHLIEEQLKAKMVAGVRHQFQYRVIDQAVPSDLNKRVQPTRTTMVMAGTLAGVLLALIVVMTRAERARKRLARGTAGG